MNKLNPPKTLTAGIAVAAIAFGGAAAAAVSPAAAISPGGQSCPGVGLIYVCGEYPTQAECATALKARNGYIDGSKAWCDEPGSTSPNWRLVASISG